MIWPMTLALRAALLSSVCWLLFEPRTATSMPLFVIFFLCFLVGQDTLILSRVLAGSYPDLRAFYHWAFPESNVKREVFQQGYQVIRRGARMEPWPLHGHVHRFRGDAEALKEKLASEHPEESFTVVTIFLAYLRPNEVRSIAE